MSNAANRRAYPTSREMIADSIHAALERGVSLREILALAAKIDHAVDAVVQTQSCAKTIRVRA